MLAIQIFAALWLLFGHLTTFVGDAPLGGAWMDCVGIPGRPVVHIAANATVATLNHELVHAADCLTGGRVTGAYGPQSNPYITLPYCLQPVELPACVAEYYPDEFLAWMGVS